MGAGPSETPADPGRATALVDTNPACGQQPRRQPTHPSGKIAANAEPAKLRTGLESPSSEGPGGRDGETQASSPPLAQINVQGE